MIRKAAFHLACLFTMVALAPAHAVNFDESRNHALRLRMATDFEMLFPGFVVDVTSAKSESKADRVRNWAEMMTGKEHITVRAQLARPGRPGITMVCQIEVSYGECGVVPTEMTLFSDYCEFSDAGGSRPDWNGGVGLKQTMALFDESRLCLHPPKNLSNYGDSTDIPFIP